MEIIPYIPDILLISLVMYLGYASTKNNWPFA